MPRTSGVSSSSTVWLRHLRPRPRTVARWSSFLPRKPLMSVILTFPTCFSAATISSLRELFDRQSALARDIRRGIAILQGVECRPYDVVRIGRSVALGQDVGYTHNLEHRAHRAPGDDAGTFGGRLHENPGRSVATLHRVMERTAFQAHLDHPAARLFHRLLNRDRDLLGLPLAHADPAVTVADDRQSGESQDAPALHHLRDAVDADHLLAQPVAPIVLLLPVLLLPAHWLCHVRSRPLCGARTSDRLRGQRRP